jgi:hypothetical protein
MTIPLKITNEDQRLSAVIGVQYVDRDLQPGRSPIHTLGPQQSYTFYVHDNQRLVVLEVRQDGPTPGFQRMPIVGEPR